MLQHAATRCNTLQHNARRELANGGLLATNLQQPAKLCDTLQHTGIHCNLQQHIAMHCNTLQHTATLCKTPQHIATRDLANGNLLAEKLKHTATH